MLSVTHNDGRSEPLINIQNCEIEEEVNGGFSLSLTSFFVDNPGYELLEHESIVELSGQEFRMTDFTHKRLSKSVKGNSTFFDLIFHRVEGIQGGTRTAAEQAAFILNGSGWTWEVQGEIPPQLFLDAFGNDNAIKLIRLMCEILKCEVQIMPNQHLVFAKEIGKDDDFQYRSKHNIKDITRSVSTSELRTAIVAYGANGLKREYRADTWELYAINGKPRYADPVTNEEITSEESLMKFAEQELGDQWIPQISIDVPVSQMNAQRYEGMPGLGDRIWLIEPSMGILFQTRIMKRKISPLKKDGLVVTLSNVKPTFTDVLVKTKVELDESKREYRSKIEQTNEMIELEVQRRKDAFVESYARIKVLSDEIDLRVKTTTYESGLNEVLRTANGYSEQQALAVQGYTDSALSTVTERLTSVESLITQHADAIALRVTTTMYENGLINAGKYADSVATQSLNNAKTYADGLKSSIDQEINGLENSISGLENEVKTTFKDGVVSEAEAKAIEKYLNSVNGEKADVDSRYTTLYADADLAGTAKSNLASAKASYDTAFTNLITAINTAIFDGKTSAAEKNDVDAKFAAYRTAVSLLAQRFDEAIDAAAQTKATSALNSAKTYADTKITDVNKAISGLDTKISSLDTYVNNSFKDGVIDAAEKEALATYIQQVNTEKAGVDSQYSSLYADTQLAGAEKTNLASAKTGYNTAHTNLVNEINTAISDSVVTSAGKTTVETNFSSYRTNLGTLRQRLEEAVRAVAQAKATAAQNAAKDYTDGATGPLVTQITNYQTSIDILKESIESKVTKEAYAVDLQNLQGDLADLDDVTGGLATRLYTAETIVSQTATDITSKVSYTDYNGNQVMSRINQTATTIKLLAEKIELTGIVRVADSLELGHTGNGAVKAIKFNGTDAWIYSPGDFGLALDASYLYMLGITYFRSGVDFSSASYIEWGSNAPPAPNYVANAGYATNAGNATTLGGSPASSYSLSGHTHSSYDYVKPSSGQSIQLGVHETQRRLNLYLNGSMVGYIPYTAA